MSLVSALITSLADLIRDGDLDLTDCDAKDLSAVRYALAPPDDDGGWDGWDESGPPTFKQFLLFVEHGLALLAAYAFVVVRHEPDVRDRDGLDTLLQRRAGDDDVRELVRQMWRRYEAELQAHGVSDPPSVPPLVQH